MQSLVGVLSAIPAASAPVGVLKLCVWSRWTAGLGKYKQQACILAPDGKTVIVEAAVEFELQNPNAQATNVHFFAGVQFKEFGLHHVEVSLDGVVVTRYPFAVVKVNQPAQQQAKK